MTGLESTRRAKRTMTSSLEWAVVWLRVELWTGPSFWAKKRPPQKVCYPIHPPSTALTMHAAPATIIKHFAMVSAGPAGSSPHMIRVDRACIAARSRILFEFSDALTRPLRDES